MSTYKLKPEVVAAFEQLGESARSALETLLEGVEGKGEYIDEIQDEYGSYDADSGLTDWDIDISERADSLISALSDLWDECQFCDAEVKLTKGSAPLEWIDKAGNKFCPQTNRLHQPEEDE